MHLSIFIICGPQARDSRHALVSFETGRQTFILYTASFDPELGEGMDESTIDLRLLFCNDFGRCIGGLLYS